MAMYLVTGGAGFIGANLVIELVRLGHQVRVIDNLSTGHMANLAEVWDEIEFIHGDLRNPEDVRKAVGGVEVVFHQAALPSVPRSIADPLATHDSNVNGTLNLLLAARDAGVRRVVYASSSSVYGNTPVLPKSESLPPSPISPYAVTKLVQELYARMFWQTYGLETVGLRYFNVFGPRQDPASQYAAVIPKFISAMMKGEHPVIFGDGEQSRDFTFVADVVQANVLAADAVGVAGEVFNIGKGDNTTINELVCLLNRVLGTEIAPKYEPARPGDVRHSLADIAKARAALGYEPRFSLEEGLRETVRWFAAHPPQCAPG